MGWKAVYEAIWKDRELPRLERIIEREKSREANDLSFHRASSMVKQLFENVYLTSDFWIKDAVERSMGKGERLIIEKVDDVKTFFETLSKYGGRGVLGEHLPREWTDRLNENFQKLFKNFESLSNSTREFSKYIIAWNLIRSRADRPIHEEVNNPRAECYAILYSFHGSVKDITDEEYKNYLKKVENYGTCLAEIVTAYQEIFLPTNLSIFLNPEAIRIFLRKYLAIDDDEWEVKIWPKVEHGLYVLGEFFLEKGPKLNEQDKKFQHFSQRIVNEWKKDLREFQLTALMSYGYDEKARKKLSAKYELGIELKGI
jgi:hypothetical protein